MAIYGNERAAQADAHLVMAHLRSWHNNRNSNLHSMPGIRQHEMSTARALLESIIGGLQPELGLQFSVGRQALQGFSVIHKNGARQYEEAVLVPGEPRELPEGSRLLVTKALQPAEDFYIADSEVCVALPEVAKALADTGRFDVIRYAAASIVQAA